MNGLSNEEKEKLICSVERIERGLYGDHENGVKGIIERVAHIEKWITRSKMKIAWMSGGVAVVVVLCKMAWEYFIREKKP